LFDSFAAGLPVIQNTKGWISDLIDQSGCGINVTSGNAESMSEAILKLADDSVFREQAASASMQLGLNEFNRDQLSETYLKLMNSITHV
jgi:glycosyltransferase involved in cell wall biosynthesis